MFNPTELLINAFVERLQQAYWRTYGNLEPAYAGIIGWAGGMALENIANSDALYHNVEHTIMVTLVGQEILKGKHLRQGGVVAAGLAAFHYLAAVSRHWLRPWGMPR